MTERTVVLLDMDGVLVENVSFESAVTSYIIERLAAARDLSIEAATAEWNADLLASKGDPEWYSYDFHCRRLGIPDLAREAHEDCRSLLLPVLGARKTLEFLHASDVIIGVVSDAMSWVVEFKMRALDLPVPDFVFSSDLAGAPKRSETFWRTFLEVHSEESTYIYVDNRIDNLDSARGAITDELHLVCFVGDEHVLQLSGILDNELERATDAPITVVADHYQLAECVVDILVSGQPHWTEDMNSTPGE